MTRQAFSPGSGGSPPARLGSAYLRQFSLSHPGPLFQFPPVFCSEFLRRKGPGPHFQHRLLRRRGIAVWLLLLLGPPKLGFRNFRGGVIMHYHISIFFKFILSPPTVFFPLLFGVVFSCVSLARLLFVFVRGVVCVFQRAPSAVNRCLRTFLLLSLIPQEWVRRKNTPFIPPVMSLPFRTSSPCGYWFFFDFAIFHCREKIAPSS